MFCEVGLRYVGDSMPGYRRRRSGRSFAYLDTGGRPIRDRAEIQRINALAIPPAWKRVWICPRPDGHLQATGRDARGRKQYRYHPRWDEVRDRQKYDRLEAFARALPRIRRRTQQHLKRGGLGREQVLAAVVRLLEHTLIRVGCEAYARDNNSYGLATIRRKHVDVRSGFARFAFTGKSGQLHEVEIDDPSLLRIVRRCHELPGQELFKYRDESGNLRDVGSGDINAYIREIAGADFTAKDFRTWGGTLCAARALEEIGYGTTKTARQRKVAEAVRRTAARLRNRPAACRKYYIHPAIFEAYERENLIRELRRPQAAGRASPPGLSREERAVLRLLEQARRTAGRKGRTA